MNVHPPRMFRGGHSCGPSIPPVTPMSRVTPFVASGLRSCKSEGSGPRAQARGGRYESAAVPPSHREQAPFGGFTDESLT
jgi:hypothetical protein